MTKSAEIRIPADQITLSRRPDASVAVVGTPNSGKSTLFNRLTGLKQRIGNYPGVTVERHIGILKFEKTTTELVDLPGTHSLSAHSLEEHITVDVIFGRMEGTQEPDGILAVLDATNLYQGLFLVQQLLDLELPVIVAMTMSDAADQSGIGIDVERLSQLLGGTPIYPVVATTGAGLEKLRGAISSIRSQTPPERIALWPELSAAAQALASTATEPVRFAEIERLLIDGATATNQPILDKLGNDAGGKLATLRDELFGREPPIAVDARIRYKWVRETPARGTALDAAATFVAHARDDVFSIGRYPEQSVFSLSWRSFFRRFSPGRRRSWI